MKTINGKIIASNLNEELKDKLQILKTKKYNTYVSRNSCWR